MRLSLLAIALSTGLAGIATAQTMPPPSPMQDGAPGPGGPDGGMRGMRGGGGGGGGLMALLMHADANGDGVITREEVIAAADARFDQLDTNHDGVLTPEEMRGGMPMQPAAGGAGAPPRPPMQPITRQQYHDRALRPFDRIDTNHDGKLDRTEIANYREMMRERRQERRGGGGGGGDMPPPPAQAGQPQ